MRLSSLRARLVLALLGAMLLGAALAWAWQRWAAALDWPWALLPALALVGLAWLLAGSVLQRLTRLLRALELAVLSYRDGDFGVALHEPGDDELALLVRRHGELASALRLQRQHLAERELLLDTVVQNTPVALTLIDDRGRVAYANIAARHLLGGGRSLEGGDFAALLAAMPEPLREVVTQGQDALFTVTLAGAEETFHHSRRDFRLQGRAHRLHLVRRMTRELSRQEVATWKRVIRVISHELNNSLAPISSLAHSGAEFARRGESERVAGALATIGDRARHLRQFLEGYAQLAKLPLPRLEAVALPGFVQRLQAAMRFQLGAPVPDAEVRIDAAQIEQALINLLKNAHESGGAASEVRLTVQLSPAGALQGALLRFEVSDRGSGMSESVLAQALLPLFSTKRGGGGLGLALVREIAEAHGGQVTLANRPGGGLTALMSLPA